MTITVVLKNEGEGYPTYARIVGKKKEHYIVYSASDYLRKKLRSLDDVRLLVSTTKISRAHKMETPGEYLCGTGLRQVFKRVPRALYFRVIGKVKR